MPLNRVPLKQVTFRSLFEILFMANALLWFLAILSSVFGLFYSLTAAAFGALLLRTFAAIAPVSDLHCEETFAD